MDKNIQILLHKIGELQKKQIFNRSEADRRGENFNVFNVIGLWSEEVRLHSAMLAELLNPEGSHGCSDAFLIAFIEDVLKKDLPNGVSSLNKAVVTTEYNIGTISDDGMKGGRIDIVIEMPQESGIPSLIIENKIYVGDQPNQLARYYHFALDNFHPSGNFKILYLTLYGSDASSISFGGCKPFPYTKLSYAGNIRKWLNRCAAIAYDKPKVRETIIQYNHLITQITAYNMDTENLIVEIASDKEYLKSAILICSQQNEIIKRAILGPVTEALRKIGKIAEDKIQIKNPLLKLKVEFKPDKGLGEKNGKLDWGFGYLITDGKHTVNLRYTFDKWGLTDLHYGISQEGTGREIPVEPIFGNQSETSPWGWEWFKYRNWNGEDLYRIIDELTGDWTKVESSDFCRSVVDSIQKSTDLFKELGNVNNRI